MSNAAPTDLVLLASRLAVEAGTMVFDARAKARPSATTKSSIVDMVTEFDKASEALIKDGLLDARPDDGIIGEEGSSIDGTSDIVWYIDPIDGTTNFLYGLPAYGVSIAAVDRRAGGIVGPNTVAGVVYIPATAELFTATAGGGAQLDGRPIGCSTTDSISVALVATGFAYRPERRGPQIERAGRVLSAAADLRRLGAASVDLCYLAAGRLDVYYEEWLSPWDMAAGELIAREAGCRTGAIDGGPIVPTSVLATNGALFDAAVQLLGPP